ncbi:MAG: VanW family protein [Patescibacteria group bacterium]|jgi:vancomycin resistance protein YoaR
MQEHHKKTLGLFLFLLSIIGVLVLLLLASTYAVKMTFGTRIYKNVSVADVNVGGMEKAQASKALQQSFEKMIAGGLTLELSNEIKSADLSPSGATDPDLVYPLLDTNIDALVDSAYQTGREGDTLAAFFGPLWYSTFGGRVITAKVNVASTRLADTIRSTFPDAESTGSPTDFVIAGKTGSFSIIVTPPVQGTSIDFASAEEILARDASDFHLEPLHLALAENLVKITPSEAESLVPAVQTALDQAPYTATFTNEYTKHMTFPITAENLKTWLLPTKDSSGTPVLTIDAMAMTDFLKNVHGDIDVSPQNAVFETEGTKVTKFEPSREGLKVDDDALIASITSAFSSGVKDIAISVMTTQPDITTAQSNSLGIEEVLGVGTSNYGVSPSNRIKNILHGASKLNGILIAPGETLSLLEHLRPFTVADGYYPELVIKGDEIKPEVGGGLCQIGTTTFRAVMNSGLKVIERRNHSLVISHYNDPTNGKPGTDATIYDPSPDFKFENDTGHTLLFTADVNTKTHELTFSFWGTSDGRKGSYVPPTVLSKSYPSSETKTIMTPDLPPGKKNCEPSFPGATTTFDYNITNPDGTITTQTFTSTYRALQKVCLEGIDPNAPPPAPATAGVTDTAPVEGIPVE